MKRLFAVLLAFACGAVLAQQQPVRVRGTITAVDGNVLSVKSRTGEDLKVHLAPEVAVTTAKATTLDALKGKYVGATAVEKDGRMVALEVHAIPPQAKPGKFPWDLVPNSSMINANLEGLAQASGGAEIVLNYPNGTQTVLVPPGTPIVAFEPGSRADLKPGETIWSNARREADGRIVAERLNVSKGGVRPPQ